MATARYRIAHKHFRLNAVKIKRAQKLLGSRIGTEAIERGLDEVIAEGGQLCGERLSECKRRDKTTEARFRTGFRRRPPYSRTRLRTCNADALKA
jgi:hypothetical protein